MSALAMLAGAATGIAWRLGAVALAVALASASAGCGLAAHDRDQAQAGLAAEQGVSDGLRGLIREQSRAVDALAEAKRQANAHGALAQQLAAAAGKRYNRALERLAGARATTCGEAMPAVNLLLESIDEGAAHAAPAVFRSTCSACRFPLLLHAAGLVLGRAASDARGQGAGARAMRRRGAGTARLRVCQADAGGYRRREGARAGSRLAAHPEIRGRTGGGY